MRYDGRSEDASRVEDRVAVGKWWAETARDPTGESTVMDGREGYDEVWRKRVRALGFAVDEPDGDADEAVGEE